MEKEMESLGDILKKLIHENGSRDTGYRNPEDAKRQHQQDMNMTQPSCLICGDFGWVRRDVSVDHPDFGQAFRCVCHNVDNDVSRADRLRKYSNMGPLSRITFDLTNPFGRSDNLQSKNLFKAAYDAASIYSEHPLGWLVLDGPSGSGKTHLASAISNRLVDRGEPILFVFVPDLLDHLRSTYSPNSEISYDQFFDQVRNAPYLVLDDLGGHNSTPWAHEKLYQIINHRYSNRMPTVITLTLPLEDLDPRWQTRLLDTELVTQYTLNGNILLKTISQWGLIEPELLSRMTFESFDIKGSRATRIQMQSLEIAYQMALNFAQEPDGWLIFIGPSGSGKTHLSVSVANERLKKNQDVRYFLVADLLDQLREAFNPESAFSYYKLFDQVRNSDLLILRDLDFDLQHATPWAREKLHQLLVHRYDARLPTLITTMELDENRAADPIMSRLQDVSVVSIIPIDAPDYRYKGSH